MRQNSIAKQEGNHAIAESAVGRHGIVGAGHVSGVGHVLCGSEAVG